MTNKYSLDKQIKEDYGGTREYDLPKIIEYLENTAEDSWRTDVVKKDGKNCLYGHLFDYGGNKVMDSFESHVATTYMFYPVNDGTHPKYPQPTPKQRCIAYIKDIQSGKELSTYASMELEYERYKREE